MSAELASTRRVGFMAAAIAIGVEGALIIWMVPGFMALLAGQAHLNDRQLGYLASWDINTMAVTIGISTFLLNRFDWRSLIGIGLALICIGNLATALTHDYLPILISRVVAGAGEGIAIGVSFAALGRAKNPDRMFAIYLVVGAVVSSCLLLALPRLQQIFGSPALFVGNAALCGLVAVSLHWFADGRLGTTAGGSHRITIDWRMAIAGLLGAFLYFLAQGEIWSYVEIIGQAHRVSTGDIAWALASANMSGVAGASLAGFLPRHWGRIWPLFAGGLLSIASFQGLIRTDTALGLILSAVLLTFAWNFAQPLISGMCSESDPEGRIVCAMGSIQTIGFGFGPALAAALLYGQNFSPIILSASVFLAVSLVVMFVGLVGSHRAGSAIAEERGL